MKLTQKWREEVRAAWGIHAEWEPVEGTTALWLTRCCRTKRRRPATPDHMYLSPLTRGFFAFVARRCLRFGVLSDLYGVHLDCEVLAPYDVHPSGLTADDLTRLGRAVGEKVRAEGFGTVVFVNGSPVRSVPYFKMLAASRLTVLYATRVGAEEDA